MSREVQLSPAKDRRSEPSSQSPGSGLPRHGQSADADGPQAEGAHATDRADQAQLRACYTADRPGSAATPDVLPSPSCSPRPQAGPGQHPGHAQSSNSGSP